MCTRVQLPPQACSALDSRDCLVVAAAPHIPPHPLVSAAGLRWMCHLWEPMKVWYEPLGFYLFMEAAALLGALALRAGKSSGCCAMLHAHCMRTAGWCVVAASADDDVN